MAGKLVVDTIDTDNAFITLNVQQSLIATMNVSGIYSNTGVKMIGANGTVSNTAITGNIVSSQITSIGGSQITANTIANSAFQTGSVENYMNAQGLGFGMRNRIINGAMVIDQRNAGASVAANGVYTLDRWYAQATINSKYTVQQNAGSVTPPAGFANYLGVTSSSAYTVGASENFSLLQAIEGYNMADFAWGTASASSITLSFRVYSSLTGTFGGSLQNSAQNRSYPFTYTISSANTWTTISITIAGETTGTWLKTNGAGIYMWIGLGVGSTYSGTAGAWASSNYSGATGAVSVVGTNAATFYITGVQLEKGSTATSFDYVDYGRLLIQCQRYFQLVHPTAGNATSSTVADMIVSCFTPMRANATLNQNGVLTVYDDQVGPFTQSSTSIVNLGNQNNVVNTIRLGNFSGMTVNRFLIGSPGNPSNYVTLSAEL